jgi:hypothetical protein
LNIIFRIHGILFNNSSRLKWYINGNEFGDNARARDNSFKMPRSGKEQAPLVVGLCISISCRGFLVASCIAEGSAKWSNPLPSYSNNLNQHNLTTEILHPLQSKKPQIESETAVGKPFVIAKARF